MSATTYEELTHQRVVDFVNFRPAKNQPKSEPTEEDFVLHTPEAPASIAQQTAVDLLRFLQAGK